MPRIFYILTIFSIFLLSGCALMNKPARPSTPQTNYQICKTLKSELSQSSVNDAFDVTGTYPLKQARLYKAYQENGCQPDLSQTPV